MSDELTDDLADVPVETAQDAVEPTEPNPGEAPPPWGDDFNPERAWRTIQHQRDREKELEQQAKQLDRLRNDPSAFREFVSEQGYELPEDEDDTEQYEPEPSELRDPRVDQLLAEREQEKRNQLVMDTAAKDVAEIQAEIKRELTPTELEKLGRLALPDENGIPRVSLAWAELKDWGAPSNKVAAPPPSGVQGSEKFDIRDPEQRQKRMAAVMEAAAAGD